MGLLSPLGMDLEMFSIYAANPSHCIKAAPHGSAEGTSQGTETSTKEEFKPATLGKPEVGTDRDNIQSTEFPRILMEKLGAFAQNQIKKC